MIKIIIILLSFTFLLGELYTFFPKGVYFHFYPLSHDKESIRWYVTGMVDRVLWLITMIIWLVTYRMSKEDRRQLYPLLVMLTIYRGMDFAVYPLNHSHAGAFYGIVYLPIIFYGAYITFKRQLWEAAEWIYSKINRNGNNG